MESMEAVLNLLADALAERIAERMQNPHKDLYSAAELAERYGVTAATIRNRMNAGEFGPLVNVGERTRLVPWDAVRSYEEAHSGPGYRAKRYEGKRSASHYRPEPIRLK